jgi:hypothetical protein
LRLDYIPAIPHFNNISPLIMRTLKVLPIVATCIAAYAIPLLAVAQQSAGNAPPPPKLEKLEEGEAPAVTIRKPEQQKKITEKRAPGGKVTEVKVDTGGSTYYLKPNDSAGSALPGDGQSSTGRGAQWEVLEFDVSRSKEAKEAQEAQAATVPPPPEAPAAPAKK